MLGAIKKTIPTILLAGLVVYFGYHGMTGEQGVLAWAGNKTRIAELEQELAMVQADRLELENRATRLRDASLDLDLVDERARELLNVSDPADMVIRVSPDGSYLN
jgi:cell division protein FtsB